MEGSVSSFIQIFKQGNCVNVKNCSLIDELNVIKWRDIFCLRHAKKRINLRFLGNSWDVSKGETWMKKYLFEGFLKSFY